MPIPIKCPSCGIETNVDDQFAGTSGPCRNCGATISVPPANPFGDAAVSAPRPSSGGVPWVPILVAMLAVALVCGGLMLAMLLPAIQAARTAAKRVNTMNQVRQIELALLNYESANGHFPPAYTVDENGTPLHSWRVLILPYLEEDSVYRQINLEEPWDSPDNLAITESNVPVVYQHTSSEGNGTHTNFLGVSGPGCMFDGSTGRSMRDIQDGTSRTISVVETDRTDVHWARPMDWDPSQPLSGNHPQGTIVGYVDGHVELVLDTTDPATINGMSTVAGGEPAAF